MASFRRTVAGFTLVELLIVAAIIGIIESIAIPSLLRDRMSANEASAAGALKSIAAAQTDYNTNATPKRYADTIKDLIDAGLLGSGFVDAEQDGYRFEVATSPVRRDGRNHWYAVACPVVERRTSGLAGTGERCLSTDETEVIKQTCADPHDQPPCESDGTTPPPPNYRLMQAARARLLPLTAPFGVEGAKDFLADDANVQAVLAALDQDRDGQLTLDELLAADPLAIARTFPGTGEGASIGGDAALRRFVARHLDWLRAELDPVTGEGAGRGVALEGLSLDPAGFLDLPPGRGAAGVR